MRVEFLKTIKNKDFAFKEGHSYEAIDGKTISYFDDDGNTVYNEDLKDSILVRQPNSPVNKDWYCIVDKKSADTLFRILPEITTSYGNRVYTKDYYIEQSEHELCKTLLSMTGNQIYDKYGFKRDETITSTVIFTDHFQMDIQLVICDGDSKPYVQAILFENGCEVACSDVLDELLDEYKLEYNATIYIAKPFVL